MQNKSNFFAEIVQSSLTHINAQTWNYACVPAHGSLIVAECGSMAIFALVSQCTTGNDDPVYTVDAYGKTQDELKREHPQIFMLLKTRINAIVVGYSSDTGISHSLSPVPAELHAFVRYATQQELALFAHNISYLPLLFAQAQHINIDELIAAFVTQLKKHQLLDSEKLCELLHVYMQLCGNDYQRARLLSKRLESNYQL